MHILVSIIQVFVELRYNKSGDEYYLRKCGNDLKKFKKKVRKVSKKLGKIA